MIYEQFLPVLVTEANKKRTYEELQKLKTYIQKRSKTNPQNKKAYEYLHNLVKGNQELHRNAIGRLGTAKYYDKVKSLPTLSGRQLHKALWRTDNIVGTHNGKKLKWHQKYKGQFDPNYTGNNGRYHLW